MLVRPSASVCRFAVVGIDDADNFGLAETLRRVRGKQAVARFLELDHARPFVETHADQPLVVFLDLLAFDLVAATDFIGAVRERKPSVVFSLYVDKSALTSRRNELPAAWRDRIGHYYKTYKVADRETELEPSVRAALQLVEWEAGHNVSSEPIRITPLFRRGLTDATTPPTEEVDSGGIAFVSYARHDWDGFVASLVANLAERSHKVWIDQDYLVGGDDWMDAIGQALQICETLLLILSPNSVGSKYVKMEYRYFFNQNKPIIPILYRPIDALPFEIGVLNYIDFTRADHAQCYQKLLQALHDRVYRIGNRFQAVRACRSPGETRHGVAASLARAHRSAGRSISTQLA